MREFNPSVETPCDIMCRVRLLRAEPDLHIATIEDELTRTGNKLTVFASISTPSFAVQTLRAYALRTQELLKIEKASWHAGLAPENDGLE